MEKTDHGLDRNNYKRIQVKIGERRSFNFAIQLHKSIKQAILFSYCVLSRFLFPLMFYNFGPYYV